MPHLSLGLDKIDHAFEDPIRACRPQQTRSVSPGIMAAANKAPYSHAGSLAGLDPADAVFNHEDLARVRTHAGRRVEKKIGRGLAAPHHLRAEHLACEQLREAGDRKRKFDAFEIAG